jgi:hypothetical protein
MMKWWGLASEPMNVNYDAIDPPQGELPIAAISNSMKFCNSDKGFHTTELALNNTAMRQQLWRLRAARSKVEVLIICVLTLLTQNSGAAPPLVCNVCATPCYITSKSSHSSISENLEAI